MATVRASCYDCGNVQLTTDDVIARICLDDNRCEYRFTCPVCNMRVVKPAEVRTIDLLVASGVKVETWMLPEELFEARSGNTVSHDEVLDLHFQLKDEYLDLNALWQELEQ